MRQVLTRRYARTARGEGKRPDLILVDGGAGQLAQAREVLAELGLSMTLLAGIVKGEGRKAEFDRLLRADGSSVPLAAEHPALHLIQSLRDEAHRFAISGHRAARGRARTASSLEEIEGIGPTRRRHLLETFGGLQGVRNAGVEELARVKGINQALAERIYHALR
jgi:excinuclease ABC subunit C